ncbi:MAG: urate hydroxylase PuuD [Alphaproteobacteria bacterium]|nr:urate hydroxylase PuuD [Alphaproteobacteria bacterium]
MLDWPIFMDWLSFAARWLHVITGIAWIGSSFYFIALDLGLRKVPTLPEGAHGEEWQVHGGGFYHIQKYLVAPAALPEHLTWFKWESYATWMSGFALMCIVYYAGADLYLIDREVWDIRPAPAIFTSILSLGIAWLLYNGLCRSPLKDHPTVLMIVLYVGLVAFAWGYTQLFTGRAAFLHLGAITATIMSANVFLVIIPNQKIVVADLKAGRAPDPKYGQIAKLRSTHNNYLTLPVLFLMLSNHYPLAFGTEYNWVIASLVFLMGVTIRHFFNSMHARQGKPWWTWIATTVLFIAIMWLSTEPRILQQTAVEAGFKPAKREFTHVSEPFAESVHFDDAYGTVQARCSMCHAREPLWPGIVAPPKGVALETAADVARHAREIYLHSGRSHAMPPANVTAMESEERAQIVRWFEGVSGGIH